MGHNDHFDDPWEVVADQEHQEVMLIMGHDWELEQLDDIHRQERKRLRASQRQERKNICYKHLQQCEEQGAVFDAAWAQIEGW
jgi:hypothetical protein